MKNKNGDCWKLVAIKKTRLNKYLLLENNSRKLGQSEQNKKCFIGKLSTPMILNRCWLLRQHDHDKWLFKNSWKTLHVVDGIHPSNAPFWKITQFFILKLKIMYCNHKTYQFHSRCMQLKWQKFFVGSINKFRI